MIGSFQGWLRSKSAAWPADSAKVRLNSATQASARLVYDNSGSYSERVRNTNSTICCWPTLEKNNRPKGLDLIGLGAGFSFVSITTAALAQVREDSAGLASGLLSSAAQLGGAVGLAVIVAAATTRSATLLGSGTAAVAAQAGGLRLGFLLAAGVALAASAVAAIALQRRKTSPATAPGTSPGQVTAAET